MRYFSLKKRKHGVKICFYLICTIILLYLFLSLRYNYYPNLWGIKTGYIDGLGWTIFEVLKFLLISILINIIACFTLKKKSFTKKATNKIKKTTQNMKDNIFLELIKYWKEFLVAIGLGFFFSMAKLFSLIGSQEGQITVKKVVDYLNS